LAEAYKKLEPEFTKKSQTLSELEKKTATLESFQKDWEPFAQWVNTTPAAAAKIQEVVKEFTEGNVSQQGINTINQQIKQADKKGDDETVKRLETLEAAMLEKQMGETFDGIQKRAEKDGLEDFTIDGFKEFAEKWMEEELGIGEDDDVSPREIRQAYTAYKAQLLEETIKSGKIPHLGSNGGGTPDAKPPKDAPKGLQARMAQAAEYLGRLK
jgi:uncharacterized phage infection (PIP) family protein YhgE